jgi:hypothetical protein
MPAETPEYATYPIDAAFHYLIRALRDTDFNLKEFDESRYSENVELIIWKPVAYLKYPSSDLYNRDATRPGLFITGLKGNFTQKSGNTTNSLVWEIRVDYDEGKLWHVDMQYTPTKRNMKLKTEKLSFGMFTKKKETPLAVYPDHIVNEHWNLFYTQIKNITFLSGCYKDTTWASLPDEVEDGKGIGFFSEEERKTYAKTVWMNWAIPQFYRHDQCYGAFMGVCGTTMPWSSGYSAWLHSLGDQAEVSLQENVEEKWIAFLNEQADRWDDKFGLTDGKNKGNGENGKQDVLND